VNGLASTQGHYKVNCKLTDDSMMRQERRAESGQLLQRAIESAQIMAQAGAPLDLKQFWKKHMEDFGILESELYFMHPGQNPAAPASGNGAGGSIPTVETMLAQLGPGGNGGTTNAALAAGLTAPSNALSMSGQMPMQQALANNGPTNV
jgi:hypothetical protein